MTEKMGRKALFMGVLEKEPPEEDSFARARMEEIQGLIKKGLEGDFSGRMAPHGPDKDWERLAESVNSFFSRIEEFGSRATLYKKIFEQQTAPFILKDTRGETLLCNPSYEELEEAAATPLEKEGIGSESMTSFVSNDGNPHTREIKIALNDGTEHIIEERSTPLRDDKGVFAVLFTLYDISDYKKSQKESVIPPVEEDRSLTISHRSFFEQIPMPGLIVDSGMKILAFNDAFLSMSGIARDDLSGMDYDSLDILESKGEDISYILENKTATSTDLTINFPTGIRVVRQHGAPVPDTIEGIEIALFYTDITAEREESSILESQVQELQYSLQLLAEESGREGEIEAEPAAVSEQMPADLGEGIPSEAITESEEPDEAEMIETSPGLEMQLSPEPEAASLPDISQPTEPEKSPEKDDAGIPGPTAMGEKKDTKTPSVESKKEDEAHGAIHDVVEFALGKENYALDIGYAREIVEMMPITPIPRAPHYLKGIINLRGEITNILDINQMLGFSESGEIKGKKIIILSSEACGGENIGIIVDDVYSVVQIREGEIEHLGDSISELSGYIKGIIQLSGRGSTEKKEEKNLLIWIDIQRLLSDLLGEG